MIIVAHPRWTNSYTELLMIFSPDSVAIHALDRLCSTHVTSHQPKKTIVVSFSTVSFASSVEHESSTQLNTDCIHGCHPSPWVSPSLVVPVVANEFA
jgi:hypothetical protein